MFGLIAVQELADEKALHVVSVCSHHKTSRLSPLISVEIVREHCHPSTSRLSPFDILLEISYIHNITII
jgi:hypothetical protein